MNEQELMSNLGYDKLISELKNLKQVQRPEILVEIDIARSHGDLKENAEYHAAREKQSFIDTRISELSVLLAKTKIVDASSLEHTSVSFGSSVEILNLDTQKKDTYIISSILESNPDENIIYYKSPLAKQLLNKKKGDIIDVKLPLGMFEYEILNISYKA